MKRSFTNKLTIIALLILFTSSTDIKYILKNSLPETSKNKKEFKRVLYHYKSKKDSLKLKAAMFLISNMKSHYSVKSNHTNKLFNFLDSIYPLKSELIDLKNYKDFTKKNTDFEYDYIDDIDQINSTFLIDNIDKSFCFWKTPWTNHLNFEQFCEYILPYRISDEYLENWRQIYQFKYHSVFNGINKDSLTLETACELLNNEIRKTNKCKIHTLNSYVDGIKPSTLINLNFGTCRDYCYHGIYAMRSLGIPVAIDMIPNGHAWNVLITANGPKDFLAADDSLGKHLIKQTKYRRIPKVYRQTFSENTNELILSSKTTDVPDVFANPFYKDVTSEYFNGANINVTINSKNKNMFAYLCQHDVNFRFVDWARIYDKKASFKNLGDSIVYFPVCYNSGLIEHVGFPVAVKNNAKTQIILKPNKSTTQNMVLYRKFPFRDRLEFLWKRTIGGKFQGANNPDFSDASDLFVINKMPDKMMNTILIDKSSYRYIRYLSPDNSHCGIAEIEFYENDNTKPLSGTVIGTDGYFERCIDCTKYKVFDGNWLTCYDAEKPNGAWVGLDLGEKKDIRKIRFIPRNDDNFVRIGDEYELIYMDFDGWKTMGRKVADCDSIVYKNVPSNCVYLLRNHTKGREERIFTYENGKQVWW